MPFDKDNPIIPHQLSGFVLTKKKPDIYWYAEFEKIMKEFDQLCTHFNKKTQAELKGRFFQSLREESETKQKIALRRFSYEYNEALRKHFWIKSYFSSEDRVMKLYVASAFVFGFLVVFPLLIILGQPAVWMALGGIVLFSTLYTITLFQTDKLESFFSHYHNKINQFIDSIQHSPPVLQP